MYQEGIDMRSQIPRETQGPSVRLGSNFAQNQSGASGMPSSPIKGDYRNLNPIPGRGGETSDSTEEKSNAGTPSSPVKENRRNWREFRSSSDSFESDFTEEDSSDFSDLSGSTPERDATEEKSNTETPSSPVKENRQNRRDSWSIFASSDSDSTEEDSDTSSYSSDSTPERDATKKDSSNFSYSFSSFSDSDSTEGDSSDFSSFSDSDSTEDCFRDFGSTSDSDSKEEVFTFTFNRQKRSNASDSASKESNFKKVQQRPQVCRKDPSKPVTGEEINEYIEKNWRAGDFVRNGISEADFTDDNIIKCIQKSEDDSFFNEIGNFGHRFTKRIIDACLERGWSTSFFARINGIQSASFTPEQFTQCVARTNQNDDASNLNKLRPPSTQFTEEHITIGLQNGWGPRHFKELGIECNRFTGAHIDLCLQNGWRIADFIDCGVPGINFTDNNITACIQNGWEVDDFKRLGIECNRFTGAHIALYLNNGWEAENFWRAKIPGTNFTDENITACIQNGWKAKDFLDLQIFNSRFTEVHITACVKNGWRGWELRGFGVTKERLQQAHLKSEDYAENGWTEWDLSYFELSDEDLSEKIFFLSYLYPRQELQKKYQDQQSAETYNKGYQELYQSRKDTTSRIDWNIPEVEEQEDLDTARESIVDLHRELKKKFSEIAVTTSSNLLYNYTMHVDPNEATLLYCTKNIVDRIVGGDLWKDNASAIISNLIKLCNSVRTYINAKDRESKKNKKADIIQACGAFLPLLEEGSDLHDIISFVKELEETFDEDATLELNASGDIDAYKDISLRDKAQHAQLFQKNIFNQHETMRKALNYDSEVGPDMSDDAYTHHSDNYNSWLQTYPRKNDVSYSKLTNIGLYQMSCKCAKIDQNIKLYRYISYNRDPLSQINGLWDEPPKEGSLKDLFMQRLEEAKNKNILLEDPAFMSTGFEPVQGYQNAVMMVICCPAGTPMYITNFDNSYHEVILPRHTQLKILNVEDVGGASEYGENCQIVLTVEVVGVGI